MNIKEVLAHNANKIELAKKINSRAGEKIVPQYGSFELREWLKERLNGARSVSEIPDLEKIMIPAPDSAIIKKLFGNKPDEIELFGKYFAVDYQQRVKPFVKIEYSLLSGIKRERLAECDMTLPGGESYEIIIMMGGENVAIVKRADELQTELKRISNKGRRQALLQRAKDEFTVSGIRDTVPIYSLLPRVANSAVIIDDEVVAYKAFSYCLLLGGGITIFQDEEEAQEITETSLKNFFDNQAKLIISLPVTDLYYENDYYSHHYNMLGASLKNHFAKLCDKYSVDLSVKNIEAKIVDLKKEVDGIIHEVEQYPDLYRLGYSEISFDLLIHNKNVKELTIIFDQVKKMVEYEDEQIIKAIYSLMVKHFGVLKRGNKLWSALSNFFPGKVCKVNPENLSLAIMEIIEP